MSETVPPAPAASTDLEKPSANKKAAKKPAKAATATARKKPAGPPVSELITKAVGASKERSGVSLAALKKALAAAGYDVDKNNSRIKLGLKSLVSKGTLVQTKGTGASGSFKLNKKASSSGEPTKPSTTKVVAKPKATGASKKSKKVTGAAAKKAVKTPKKVKKPAVTKKPSKSPKKPKAVKPKKVVKSPAKAVKPKAAKGKVTKPKTAAKPKKAAPKKK
ncbi:histone H1.1 [Saccopteryx bilineata]|uniref:histone H1.1 n=1 Tax=Saccopteryx bilineata TaxID=59482 RepID=UPI00339001DD